MDPNETLDRLRWLAANPDLLAANPDLAEDWAEAFTALDDWLSRGGFLPTDWSALRVPGR